MTSATGGVVLAAVDGSAEAADGADVAGQLARAWGAQLHLVHVWAGLAPALMAVIAESAARRVLADEAVTARRRGAVVSEQHFLVGGAAAGIEELADELGASLCVLGQHRRSRFGDVVFGSVAADLLMVTRRPLLLVTSADNWPPQRILVGNDGSPAALAAERLAAKVAGLYHADMTLVRATGAVLGTDRPGADVDFDEQHLAGDARRLERRAGVRAGAAVVHASANAALRDAGKDGRALVAVGTRQQGGLRRWAEGSVSLELVRSAGTLLVVPPPGALGRHAAGSRSKDPSLGCPSAVDSGRPFGHPQPMDVDEVTRQSSAVVRRQSAQGGLAAAGPISGGQPGRRPVLVRPVLLAASGDDVDATARAAAVDVAKRSRAPLHILLVWSASTEPGSLSGPTLASAARVRLEHEVQVAVASGVSVVRAHLSENHFPAREIHAVAAQVGAGLIVTGSHGGGPLFRLLHDSVSETVVRDSGCPVLVTPPGSETWPPRRLVIADDLSEESDQVVQAGAEFARLLAVPAELVAVRTARNRSVPDAVIGRHAGLIGERTGVAPSVLTLDGDPVKRILDAAAGASTLVVAGHRWPARLGAWETRVSTRVLHEHRGASLIAPQRRVRGKSADGHDG